MFTVEVWVRSLLVLSLLLQTIPGFDGVEKPDAFGPVNERQAVLKFSKPPTAFDRHIVWDEMGDEGFLTLRASEAWSDEIAASAFENGPCARGAFVCRVLLRTQFGTEREASSFAIRTVAGRYVMLFENRRVEVFGWGIRGEPFFHYQILDGNTWNVLSGNQLLGRALCAQLMGNQEAFGEKSCR